MICKWFVWVKLLVFVFQYFQYLSDLRERGVRIIIGDFFESPARHIMCQAYKMGMTQKEGYVWFLPELFEAGWYDIDRLKTLKKINRTYSPLHSKEDFRSNIDMHGTSEIGNLPNCTTKEMLTALDGHMSLMHANLATDDTTIPDGRTVGQWKKDFTAHLNTTYQTYIANRKESHNPDVAKSIKPDTNSGYVYDAVLLYAKALHKLVEGSNQSYIQSLHSDRTVTAFVKIIKEIDFTGVSGRINFKSRASRLSNIRIMQWHVDNNTLNKLEVGVYEPNYELESDDNDDDKGKMIIWKKINLKWKTKNGRKPLHNPIECGALSTLATDLGIECQVAITFTFLLGLAVVVFMLFISFLVQRRRYEMKMAATEERMRSLGMLSPTNVLTLDEWEIPRDRVVINRKLGEGAFGQVFGGEFFIDDKGWVG